MGEIVQVRLHTPPGAPLRRVILRTIPNGEQQFTQMRPFGEQDGLQVWTAEMTVREKRMPYRFILETDETLWWFNALGASLQMPFELFDFKLLADFPEIPWLKSTVFYQVFPDRFANGDPTNDPADGPIGYRNYTRRTYAWGETPAGLRTEMPFYGGDLQGITQKLDYLQSLGVNALYLNPVFSAYTNHRYDVSDYYQVDPVLGGDAALIRLREALAQRGMRYILDIVPNHCGVGHTWFQTACADPASPEASFFFFKNHPADYTSWMGFGSLPKLNYKSLELRERMYAGPDAVFRYWLKPPFSADGWRVDVANMLARSDAEQYDREVLPGIRQAVKETNPEAYIVGENFYEAASQLQGDAWDGVMNYTGFTNPLAYWLMPFSLDAIGWKENLVSQTRWDTQTLVNAWREHLAAIPWAVALQQLNLLDSHDTARIRSVLHGSDALVRLAAILQFTFPGVPCLYYGDEIGLADEEGFGSRNCMPWDAELWDLDLLNFYRRLVSLRKESRVLSEGAFEPLYWQQDLLICQRFLADERILVTANRADQTLPPHTASPLHGSLGGGQTYRGLFGGQTLRVAAGKLHLPELPQGGEIWLAQ